MSTQLDPEDYRDVIFAYQRAVAREIERFSGFVAKYMGDGVLAYFGYPAAQEDDAERSIRAALAVAAAVEAMPSTTGRLRARIGIATGQVIIGDLVGEGVAREQAIAGETPNLAARLQPLAEGGGVVICSETRALVGELFELATLGPVALKGFDRPQRAFRVRATNEGLSRFEALRSQDSSFVGREEELAILARRWAWARDGEPQIVLLSADAGVGKSRLMSTFRHQTSDDDRQTLSVYCAPYARDSAFHPFLRALEARCGFASVDDGETKRTKLQANLEAVFGNPPRDSLEMLASLLSLGAEVRLTPQRQKEEATQLLADLALRAADNRPLLVVVEDAHWIDPSSLEVLRAIVRELKPGLKLMVMVSHRPEFRPPSEWLGQPNVTLMMLSRLRSTDAQTMLAQIAGGRDLNKAAAEQILTHADGVPLYIEEITRAVLERRDAAKPGVAGAAELNVPTTLQASLLGRLDRLSSGKEIAQIGAAIGRDFPRPLLAAVAQKSPAELDAALGELIKAELIVPSGAGDTATFMFRHALIQDVAYGALLRGPRQSLHDRIATAMVAILPDQAEARPEVLARHLAEAQRWPDAARQWRKAAVKTLRSGAWNEGLRHLEAGLRAVSALADGRERDAAELDLQMMVGGVSMGVIGHSSAEAQSAYERAYALARGVGDRRNAALAGSRRWLAAYGAGDLVRAESIVAQSLEELGADLEPVEHALVKSTFAGMLQFQGRFTELEAVLAETELVWAQPVELAPEEYYFMNPATQGLAGKMVQSLVTGRLQGCADTWSHVAGRLETMDPVGAVICVTMLIYMRYVAGDWASMPVDLARFDDIVSRIEGPGHYRNLSRLVGARLRTMGGDSMALAEVADVMSGVDLGFAQQHVPRYQMIAGDAHMDLGDTETARAYYSESLKGGRLGSQQWLRSEVLRRLGDLAKPAAPEESRRFYAEALETARTQGAPLFELRAALALADLGDEIGLMELRRIVGQETQDGPNVDAARDLLNRLAEPSFEGAESLRSDSVA